MNSNIKIMKKIKINRSGMTLIEIVVALAIMGIVVIGLLPMFSTGIKLLVDNGKQINIMYSKQFKTEEQISRGTESNLTSMQIIFPGKTIDVEGENMLIDSYYLFIPYSKKIAP